MGKYGVCKNAYIQVAGVDLSDHCSSLDPTYGNNALPMQTMGNSQEYSSPGLRTRGLSAKFLMDFAAGSVFSTLNPLKNGAYHVVQYRQDKDAAVSALNPTYSGLWFISNLTGLVGGAIGSQTECTVTWTPSGDEAEITSA
jgi:hypothetical protein